MDVAIITIAVIVIHVWRTMMEEIYRCQHLFTENDLDVATGTMRWMECRSQWLMCHGRVGDTFTKPEKDEMPNSKPCRKDLLMQIGHASFAVDDVKLYLDTHPRDQEALDFFYEYNKKRNQLLKEYAKYYGPLTVDTAVPSCSDRWNWINEPWPWQEGGC